MQLKDASSLGPISASLYVSFQVIANVLSTKIALVPIVHWSIDGGTVIYPLTFTLRDFVHKTLGKRSARTIVILAGLVNVFAVLLFLLVGKLAPDPAWIYQDAYQKILLPVWRITAASIIAQITSELVDTEIFSRVYKKTGDVSAVFFSNSISLVVDSVLFCTIAFAISLPLPVVLELIVVNILVKFVMSTLSTPSIKLVPRTVDFDKI